MDLVLKHLPAVVHDEILRRQCSILDAGCAEGDGTALLAETFTGCGVAGFDFSSVAIGKACRNYPRVEFFASTFEDLERTAQVIVSSNCLEHVPNAMQTLRALARRTERYLIVLVPYLELYPLHSEHLRQIHADTFPAVFDRWQLTYRVLIPPSSTWEGYQLLLIYECPRRARRTPLAPLPDAAAVALSLRGLGTREILAEHQTTISALNTSLAAKDQAIAALRREREARVLALEAELGKDRVYSQHLAAEREATVAALNARLAEADKHLALVQEEHEATVALMNSSIAAKDREKAALRREMEAIASAGMAAHEKEKAALEGQLHAALIESHARHEHLAFAMQELDRWRNSWWARLQRTLQGIARGVSHPRETLGRLTARDTRIYWLVLKVIPRPLARWMRRTLAPLPPPASAQVDPVEAPDAPVAAVRQWPRPNTGEFRPTPAGRYDIVVLSLIDWDFRFQRPQQIASQFARNGHRVFYLSTTKFLTGEGPDWDLTSKGEGVAELRIRAPFALDVYGGVLRSKELEILENAFGSLARQLAIGDAVCFVHAPAWEPLARRLREHFGWRVVYECMDEWANFPGFNAEVLALEMELVRDADLTVVTSDRLLDKWNPIARKALLARNAVDLRHYRTLYGDNTVLGEVARPVIGYYGALANWVDIPLIEKVATRYPQATIALAGGHFNVDLSSIASLPNVRLLGQRPYEEMPRLLWNFDVCLIPFLVNDITEATNPVKFYEYMFGGKPVVATDLPELRSFGQVAYLARDHEEFISQLDLALAEPLDDPRREKRRSIAEANSWSVRHRLMDDAVQETYPLVSVVVVTYGGLELTKRCLDSLLDGETWPRLEIIVVDNASPDGTAEYLRSLSGQDPQLRCFLNSQNLGFPAATNRGVREARGEIVVFLNNDTVVPPGLIGRLVTHLTRDKSIGIVCPTTNFCGNEARVDAEYADLADLPFFAAERAWNFAGKTFDLAVAAMYCVAVRAEILQAVGPLDEAFGIGLFEDDDLSLRMRKAGFRVVCAEDAYVHHEGQGSFKRLSQAEYSALWSRNQAYFETKWGVAWEPHRTRAGVRPPNSQASRA